MTREDRAKIREIADELSSGSTRRGSDMARKKSKRKVKRVCPVHRIGLVATKRNGLDYWYCPEAGCDVRCWGGDTSTPCTAETADLRIGLHHVFDPLWKQGARFAPASADRRVHRKQAYRWLAAKLAISVANCHIGFFSADQCRKAIEHVKAIHETQDMQDMPEAKAAG